MAQTNIIKHVKEYDDSWSIVENDEKIFTGIPSEELAEKFEEFICNRDLDYITKIEILGKEKYALEQLSEFSMKLISDTLSDKLSDLDNMYALKMMLKETVELFEQLLPKLKSLEKQNDEG